MKTITLKSFFCAYRAFFRHGGNGKHSSIGGPIKCSTTQRIRQYRARQIQRRWINYVSSVLRACCCGVCMDIYNFGY